jgi:hypothetical protein
LGNHPNRNEQIENIGKIKAKYIAAGNPVISIDTKKKELIGNFSRDGKTYTQIPVETFDHDFPSISEGKLIPHGIYDVALNEGHLNLNTSHDTSEFCCDSIAHWGEFKQTSSKFHEIFINARYSKGLNDIRTSQI